MAQREPLVVVLTGGPSSGKSSALALLRDRLSARGFQVLTVPENATHFLSNSDGFQASWAGTESQERMQRIFLDFQIAQEEAFLKFAALNPKPAVLLLDCCTLNSKVYVSDAQWQGVLRGGRQTEADLLARYDLVIHMVTCAHGEGYEWGPGSNNPARYHSPEEAQASDKRSLEVFAQHPQLRVVPHCVSFDDKIGKVLEFVKDALHIDGLSGKRRRCACRILAPKKMEALLSAAETSTSVITCVYLDKKQSLRRNVRTSGMAWKCSFAGPEGLCPEAVVSAMSGVPSAEVMYERRSQRHIEANVDPFLTRKAITEADYYDTLADFPEAPTVTKHVLRFVLGSDYYELFFFFEDQEFVLDFADGSESLPDWLQLLGDSQNAAHTGVSPEKSEHVSPEKSEQASSTVGDSTSITPDKKRRRLCRHTTEEAAFTLPLKAAAVAGDVNVCMMHHGMAKACHTARSGICTHGTAEEL